MHNTSWSWKRAALNAASFILVGAVGAILYYVGSAAWARLPSFTVRES